MPSYIVEPKDLPSWIRRVYEHSEEIEEIIKVIRRDPDEYMVELVYGYETWKRDPKGKWHIVKTTLKD